MLPANASAIKKTTREQREAYTQQQRDDATTVWNSLDAIPPDSAASRYLEARGLKAFITHPALRGNPYYFHKPSKQRLPVLAARIWHVKYGLSGYQITYLEKDGHDRNRTLEPGRTTHGIRRGGAVWIGAPVPGKEVVVGEGLESTLSAMLLLNLRCGAAILGPDLRNLRLPSSVKHIHIAADNDETGRRSAEHAATVWRGWGHTVRVSMPHNEGEDFNDVLLRRWA
jgi:hypothetical protein